MAQDDAQGAHAHELRGEHVVPLAQGRRHRPDDAGRGHPAEHRQDEDEDPPVARQLVRDQGEDEEGGHDQQEVDEGEGGLLRPAPEVGGARAHDRRDGDGQDGHGHRDHQRALEAVRGGGVDVVAALVGAEPVLGAGGLGEGGEVGVGEVVRGEQFAERAEQHEQQQDHHTGDGGPVAPETAQVEAAAAEVAAVVPDPRVVPGGGGEGAVGGGGEDAVGGRAGTHGGTHLSSPALSGRGGRW